jgi:trk system potassium uptake protein TrkH
MVVYSKFFQNRFFLSCFIDALFTSTSATCVTGLIVTSTSENFTFIGELIILTLIQIGGIGYMSLVIIFFLFVKDHLSFDEKRATKLSLDLPDLHVGAFTKKILSVVFIVESSWIGLSKSLMMTSTMSSSAG